MTISRTYNPATEMASEAIRASGAGGDVCAEAGSSLPMLGVLFLIPALSLAGLPPLSGFWSKFTLIKASLDAGHIVLAATGLLVGLLTLYSMLKIWNEAFWKTAPANAEETVQDWQADRKTRLLMLTPIATLAAITLTIGLFAEPFVDFSLRAGEQLLNKSIYIDAVFGTPIEARRQRAAPQTRKIADRRVIITLLPPPR